MERHFLPLYMQEPEKNQRAKPIIMGIVNLNTDSFFAQSRLLDRGDYMEKVGQMLEEGAQIIDLGAQSTRPAGAAELSETEEEERLLSALENIRKIWPQIPISVDSYRSNIALKCLNAGAGIINDISGGKWDKDMYSIVAKHNATLVLMHLEGNFETMHQTEIHSSVFERVYHSLQAKISDAKKSGIDKIWIDPGFGFSKSLQQNWELLAEMGKLKSLNYPILAGISRKRMIAQPLHTDAQGALYGTIAAHMVALQNGADILRVHDVKAASDTIAIFMESENSKGNSFYSSSFL